MSFNFNTVGEVTKWRNFEFEGKVYDLSHLNAHHIEYFDAEAQVTYAFIVTYGHHCFTKDSEQLSPHERSQLFYSAPNETRPFNFERYELSKNLPEIIQSLDQSEAFVFHAGYSNYAVVKVLTPEGIVKQYQVIFKVFKEKKRLRIHVISAYFLDKKSGKRQKVRFLTIAKNLKQGKKLPMPRK